MGKIGTRGSMDEPDTREKPGDDPRANMGPGKIHYERTQGFTGDGATGANRAYGNVGGNQGMVQRETKNEDH